MQHVGRLLTETMKRQCHSIMVATLLRMDGYRMYIYICTSYTVYTACKYVCSVVLFSCLYLYLFIMIVLLLTFCVVSSVCVMKKIHTYIHND